MGDKLVIKLGERLLGLDTDEVERITEAERLSFIPGKRAFVNGMISLRGEPVVVVDTLAVYGRSAPSGADGAGGGGRAAGAGGKAPQEAKGAKKIVVVKDKRTSLGLDIGRSEVYFLWEEDISDKTVLKGGAPFISARIETEGAPVELIDWGALFNEAKKILSAKGHGV